MLMQTDDEIWRAERERVAAGGGRTFSSWWLVAVGVVLVAVARIGGVW